MTESTEPAIHEPEYESLGTFLRRTREERGIDIQQIVDETRISGSNLRAMEANDFDSLPADAFARGFYALYAKSLQLNPDEMVARFLMERGHRPSHLSQGPSSQNPPPNKKAASSVAHMADRSNGSPVSTIGFVLLLLVIIGGGVCWYLSINPATYLSEKLRGFQEDPPAVTLPAGETTPEQPASQATYILTATFAGQATLSIRIDDFPERQATYQAGQTITWEADESISISLSGKPDINFVLNGSPVELPSSDGTPVTFEIPGDLGR